MTDFKKTFLGKEFTAVEDFFDKEKAQAIEILEPSILALEKVIKDKGPDFVKSVVLAMSEAAGTALSNGINKSGAGKAAFEATISAGETKIITGLEALGEDVAHAVGASIVTGSETND